MDTKNTINSLKILFAASCVSLFVSFSLTFVDKSYNKDYEYYDENSDDDDDLADITFNDFCSITNLKYAFIGLDNYNEEIEDREDAINELRNRFYSSDSDNIVKVRDEIEDLENQKRDTYIYIAFYLASRLSILIFIMLLALSAYYLGCVSMAKENTPSKRLPLNIMRYISIVPLVTVVALFILEDFTFRDEDIVEKDQKYIIATFSYIPMLISTVFLTVSAWMVKRQD